MAASGLPPLPDDSEQLFLRSDAAGSQAMWMMLGGAGCVAAAIVGFAAALLAQVDQVQLHLMATVPTIASVALLAAGWSLRSAPRQVSVGPQGLAIEGRAKQMLPWDQIGWATVGMPGMGGKRVLTIYDTQGKSLAAISEAFDQFDVLVGLVKSRVAARPDDMATRIQTSKSRRTALLTLGTGTLLLAACIAIAWMTRWEQRASQLLAERGEPGEGVIVRRFLAPNGVTPRLEYRAKTPAGEAPARNAEVRRDYWDSLEGAATVPIIVVPGEPGISRLAEGEVLDKEFLKQPLGGYGLAGLGGLLSLFLLGVGLMQLSGWDIDLDSKTGKVSIKRFGAGT